MTFGEPNMSCGIPPEDQQEQLKVPSATLGPLEA